MTTSEKHYHPDTHPEHRDVSGGWLRPAVFGAMDGLVTNVSLISGVGGGGGSQHVIVLTGLCVGVVKMPDSIVFGRVLPALGIALPIGNLFYAWLAYQLSRKEGRGSVTALPYGPSVPHMFIVVFLVMLPTYLKTNDPILAWQAGLAWAFIIGCVVLPGAFIGPTLRTMRKCVCPATIYAQRGTISRNSNAHRMGSSSPPG